MARGSPSSGTGMGAASGMAGRWNTPPTGHTPNIRQAPKNSRPGRKKGVNTATRPINKAAQITFFVSGGPPTRPQTALRHLGQKGKQAGKEHCQRGTCFACQLPIQGKLYGPAAAMVKNFGFHRLFLPLPTNEFPHDRISRAKMSGSFQRIIKTLASSARIWYNIPIFYQTTGGGKHEKRSSNRQH